MKKVVALVTMLAFAAPLAAFAQAPAPSVAQKVEQTYHTQFPLTSSGQNGGIGG